MSGAEAGHHPISTPSNAPAPAATTLEGWSVDLLDPSLDPASRSAIIEKAFDFRGDVVLSLRNGTTVAGYLFDRRAATPASDGYVRLMPPPAEGEALGATGGSLANVRVAFADIARIQFGKDAAHGKTWENWVKRYVEKKRRGEAASIEAEVL